MSKRYKSVEDMVDDLSEDPFFAQTFREKQELKADIVALKAKLAKCEEALRPFADYIKHRDPFNQENAGDTVCETGGAWVMASRITVGDCRRAAELSSTADREGR